MKGSKLTFFVDTWMRIKVSRFAACLKGKLPYMICLKKGIKLTKVSRFYEQHGKRTQAIAASLTSIHEVMMLAGVAHITVSPPLLYELSKTPASGWEGDVGSVFKSVSSETQDIDGAGVEDKKAWRLTFSRDQDGKSQAKLNDAIKLFSEKQDALEDLVGSRL